MDQKPLFYDNIVNKSSMVWMVTELTNKLDRKLNKHEITDFYEFVKQNRAKNWKLHIRKNGSFEKAAEHVRKVLVKNYLTKRFTKKGRVNEDLANKHIDIHEIMKLRIGTPQEDANPYEMDNVNADGIPITHVILPEDDDDLGDTLGSLDEIKNITNVGNISALDNVTQILGLSDPTAIQLLFNPVAAYKWNYIIMDSKARLTNTDGTTEQSWDFLNDSAVNTIGAVNSLGGVKSVTAITIDKIRIPYEDVVILNGYNRVTLLIKEFSGQAFIGQEGRKFHFIFNATTDGNMIDLEPLNFNGQEAGIFEFAKPITQIDRLTLTWGNPLELITFDKDRINFDVTYANPGSFTTTSGEEHNLLTGDLVYITTFTSNDTVTDEAIINQTNAVNGHNIVKVDDFTFEIDGLDLTTVTAQIVPQTIEIFLGSKRFFVPLGIRYIP